MDKFMAKFWGERHQVWVGLTEGGVALKGVIALKCPPYYPPHLGPGTDASSMSKPENFPYFPEE
ncbi:MAG: hypothetical protein OHK0039_15320 [Bacteroidia bacterium]